MPNTSNSPTEHLVGNIDALGGMSAHAPKTDVRAALKAKANWGATSGQQAGQRNHIGNTLNGDPAGTAQAGSGDMVLELAAQAKLMQAQADNALKQAGIANAERVRSETRTINSTPVSPLTFPPGQVGELAKLFLSHSHRPVPEVSILAAVMFVTAPCGLRWQISDTGLNMYAVLSAMSGVGKEDATSSIGWMLHGIKKVCANASSRFVFGEFASAPGLMKYLAEHRSVLHVSNEIGQKFAIWNDGRSAPEKGLKTLMTALYTKSSATATAGGIVYSDNIKTVEDVGAVSYSLLGDTTPEVYHLSLNGPMMEDGFLSRFDSLNYKGARPAPNKSRNSHIPQALLNHWVTVFNHADLLDQRDEIVIIDISPEALKMLNGFNDAIDADLLTITNNSIRQSRLRGHLKSLKISGLLAVADNPYTPQVTTAHAEWAINFVRAEIAEFDRLLEMGDIRGGNDAAEVKVTHLLRKYLSEEPKASYGVDLGMWKAGIIPWSYLQMGTSSMKLFAKTNGANPLKGAVQNLIDCGVIAPLSKSDAAKYGSRAACYTILNV